MNYVFLSPHFPPNWFNFCVRLKESGFNVLGLGDEPYDSLRAELRNSLTEYYRVENMHNYDQLVRAIGFFIWKYGKIDFIESHNEYWLETEANLRDDFNVNGYRKGNIEAIKRKSIMKRVFQVANIPVAPGQIAISFETAKDFAEKNGYPLIAKPDIGVGAYATYKIHDDQELFDFFTQKPDVTYFLECFIDGTIITFDGLTDKDGKVVFSSSLQYSNGIMETVNNDLDIYYWLNKEIPKDVREYGINSINAFEPKARFFHLEFFKTNDNKIIALEANLRPPGGFTIDMWNFANNIDLYKEYANILKDNKMSWQPEPQFWVFFFGRKRKYSYIHSHEEVLAKFGKNIMYQTVMPDVYHKVMGQDGFIFRVETESEMREIVDFLGAKT